MGRLTKFTHAGKLDDNDYQRRKRLGELLGRARRQSHLSQAAVARTLGYSHQSNISSIENAARIIDPIELENFARLYGKSLNDFATMGEEPSTAELGRRAKLNRAKALEFQRRYYKKERS